MVRLLERADYKTMTKDELKEYKKELMTEIFNVRNALAPLKKKAEDMMFSGKYKTEGMKNVLTEVRKMNAELETLRNTYEKVRMYLIDMYEAY